MTHYYTACLASNVEAVKIRLQGDGHALSALMGFLTIYGCNEP